MRFLLPMFAPALVVVALIIALATGHAGWRGADYKPDMLSAGVKTATALFVLSIFLERSLAVINALLFGKEKKEAEARLASAERLAPSEAQAVAELRLSRIAAHEERVRVGVGLLVATVVSAAGARSLIALMSPPTIISGQQYALFLVADVLLTAGLLAGGSNGLAALIELLRKQADVTIRSLSREVS